MTLTKGLHDMTKTSLRTRVPVIVPLAGPPWSHGRSIAGHGVDRPGPVLLSRSDASFRGAVSSHPMRAECETREQSSGSTHVPRISVDNALTGNHFRAGCFCNVANSAGSGPVVASGFCFRSV